MDLLRLMKEILKKPKQRSNRWISASTAKVASAEYFVKALQSQISFQDLDCHFGDHQLVLEIGNGRFSELLGYTVTGKIKSISFGSSLQDDGLVKLLEVLGR